MIHLYLSFCVNNIPYLLSVVSQDDDDDNDDNNDETIFDNSNDYVNDNDNDNEDNDNVSAGAPSSIQP